MEACTQGGRIVWATTLLLLLALALAAGPGRAAEPPVAQAAGAFAAAYQAWDTNAFAAAEALAQRAVAERPDDATGLYWKAVIQFHQVLAALGSGEMSGPDRAAADARIGGALASLDRLLELEPRNAEGWALRGTLTGIRIGLHPASAAWRGPRVLRDNRRALDLGADNARVRYLLGTSAFFGPSIVGGRTKALAHFQAAEALFEREQGKAAGPLEPRWGRASALVFAARCCQDAGRPAEAEAYVARALALNPKVQGMLGALRSAERATEGLGREEGARSTAKGASSHE